MPIKNHDLHGSAPDQSSIALLLIDVINDLEFEEGEKLLKTALPAARKISALKQRAKAAGIPVIYVNDNFGRWKSDFKKIVEHVLNDDVRGRELAILLPPEEDDYFVLKPKHSGFFSTTLDILLDYLGTRTLILTGFAGNICVLFTAHDAHMRDFEVIVPADCTASNTIQQNEQSLEQLAQVLGVDTRPSEQIDFGEMLRIGRPAS